jgi:hypothetical protein
MVSPSPIAKLIRNSIRAVILVLLTTLMISCTPQAKPPLVITPSMTAEPSISPSPANSATNTVLSISTPTNAAPSIASAADIVATDSVHSIYRGIEAGCQLTLDDHYIYLVEDLDPGSIYRIPLNGGKPQKIAGTKYAGGRLNFFAPVVTRNWIIFADTPDQGIPGRWMIRAVNLQNFSERLVAQNGGNDPLNLVMTYNLAADGDNLYWTMDVFKTGQAEEDIISMMDLNTGETVELTRSKINGAIWAFLGASEGRLVVEQDSDDKHGGGTNIFLFDPADGQPQALSTDGASDMPQFVYPWVVWKAGPRYHTIDKIGIYNLQTSQTRVITLPGQNNSDILGMDGARVYWTGPTDDIGSYYALYILDLINNMVYVLPASKQYVQFPGVAIHGRVIAWLRAENMQTNQPAAYLEWTTIK